MALLEREREIAQALETIEQARSGTGGVLLIEGPAGIGKTAVLGRIRSVAAEIGLAELKACGGEMERDFAFGIVRQLLDPPLRRSTASERDALLEGAARLAGSVLGVDVFPGSVPGDAPDAFALMHGLYWLVSNLAERAPLLVSVDDAHWSDAPSAGFVHYLARRVEDLPVVLALAARPSAAGAELEALKRIAGEPASRGLRPGPLSSTGTAELVRSLLSVEADDEFCQACHEATGGNPLLVHELVRELRAEGIPPTASEARRVSELAPEGVGRAVFLRLARLPDPALRLVRAVAVLGDSSELRHAAALAGLDEAKAAGAVDALVAADILTAERPLSFLHPLIRQVIYRESLPGERALAHARAARILHGGGVADEEVASHLLAAEPGGERWRVDVLRRAATSALERDVPRTAVRYLRRALAEPLDPQTRNSVLVELGVAEARTSDPVALQTLGQALTTALDPGTRARVALELAQATELVVADPAGAAELLEQTVENLADVDRDLALRLEAEYLANARLFPITRARARERLRSLRQEVSLGQGSSAHLLANLALEALESGAPAEEAKELAQQALAGGGLLAENSLMLFSYAANTLTWTDRLELALRQWDAALAEVRRRGSAVGFVFVSIWRAHLAYRRGAMLEVEADARGALQVSSDLGLPPAVAYASGFLADALIERGQLDEASHLLAQVNPELSPFVWDSRGRLEYLGGRFAESLENFLASGEMLQGRGGGDTPGIIPWRSGAALAHAALGNADDAERMAEEEVELARAQGAPRALGIALRASGLVQGGIRGLDLLRESVTVLDASPSLLERARALVDLGAALRRAGHRSEARDPLRQGMDLAHRRCRATALVDRARAELLATGARPRRPSVTGAEALTPSERRVAALAAEGRTNRQIAQALFLSIRTVGVHLSRVYQKLGISGREELSRAGAVTSDKGNT